MKLSKKAYYGLRACLALMEAKAPLSIHALAEQEGIPEDYLEKILQTLRRQGLLEAERGSKGGYRVRDTKLSAWDVVRTLDGPLKVYPVAVKGTLPASNAGSVAPAGWPCPSSTHCQANTIFRHLEENLEQTLKNTRLAEFGKAQAVQHKAPVS